MKQRKFVLISLVVSLFALQGCEKVSALTDYFSSKPKTAQSTKPKAQPPAAIKKQDLSVPKTTSAQQPSAAMTKNVLARVGSWSITIEDFKDRLAALKDVVPDYDINDPEANKLILDELIRQELLVQSAENSEIAHDKTIIQAVDEFRRTLFVRELATKLTEGLEATEEEAQEYYNDNKDDFVSPTEWKLREIVVGEEAKAKQILIDLYKGEGADFEQIAREHSTGPTAEQGGELGFVTEFTFPKMESAVKTLEVGDISSVFKGPDGFYLIKLEEKQGGEPKEFEEIKNEIQQGLTLLKQQQAILNHLEKIRQKTLIEVNEKLLEG